MQTSEEDLTTPRRPVAEMRYSLSSARVCAQLAHHGQIVGKAAARHFIQLAHVIKASEQDGIPPVGRALEGLRLFLCERSALQLQRFLRCVAQGRPVLRLHEAKVTF